MAAERPVFGENESVFNSRLFKGGTIVAVVAAAFSLWGVAAVGVIVAGAGAGLHVWKGKNR